MYKIQNLDLLIILAYFVVVLAIGFYIARRKLKPNANEADYFLAGRNLSWVAIGFSLFASNISSTTLIGLSGAAYSTGISISNYEWMAAVVLVFFAIYFVPYYVGNNIFTMPEFLEKRFDSRLRYYFSAITIVGNIFIDTAGTLFAGALVVNYFFPSLEYWQSASLLALIAGLYTAAGGLAAVVYTDVIQAVILLVGSILIFLLAYEEVGPWSQVVAQTPPELLSVVRPRNDPTMPWTGLVTGVPILGFYFWCTNQFIVQRVLGAKNIHHARWGALLGGLLKLPVLFIMVYPGVMARLLYPELDSPDLVFPTMVSELLPTGLRGIVLAGLVAAIMSSVDSTLHSASTLVTIDFVKKLKPHWSPQQLTHLGRIVTVLFMIISISWLPVVMQFETLFSYLQSALAYLVPPVAAVFLVGLFWPRATSNGALSALIFGHFASLTYFVLSQIFQWKGLHFLEFAGILTLVSSTALVGVSLLDKKPEVPNEYVWSRSRVTQLMQGLSPSPWYYDYRLFSAVLLLLTGWLVIANW